MYKAPPLFSLTFTFISRSAVIPLHFYIQHQYLWSGVGTNLKVGAHVRRFKILSLFCPSTMVARQVQLVVLASAFVMVSTIWSVFVCCSSAHGAPISSHLNKWGHIPPVSHGVGATVSVVLIEESVCRLSFIGVRLSSFVIGLTDVSPATTAPTLWNYDVCGQGPSGIVDEQVVPLTCTTDMPPRRYLIVQLPSLSEFMNFCEIEVYIRRKSPTLPAGPIRRFAQWLSQDWV